MNLISYIRCSEDDQGERHSVETQRRMNEEYARLYDHVIINEIIDDGVSGGVAFEKRPGGLEVTEALRQGVADGFIARDLERAFRDVVDGLTVNRVLEKRGQAMHFVNDKIDTKDPDGFVMFVLKLAMAERERIKASRRSSEVSDTLREQGRCGGQVPYGCINIDGYLFRDKLMWKQRQMIVDLRREEEMSYNGIANHLNQRHIPTSGGGKFWHASSVRSVIESHHAYEHIPFADEQG